MFCLRQPIFVSVRHSARELDHQPIYKQVKTMRHAVRIPNAFRRPSVAYSSYVYQNNRWYHASPYRPRPSLEPRLEDHGRVIHDEYSVIRDKYGKLHPINLWTSDNESRCPQIPRCSRPWPARVWWIASCWPIPSRCPILARNQRGPDSARNWSYHCYGTSIGIYWSPSRRIGPRYWTRCAWERC